LSITRFSHPNHRINLMLCARVPEVRESVSFTLMRDTAEGTPDTATKTGKNPDAIATGVPETAARIGAKPEATAVVVPEAAVSTGAKPEATLFTTPDTAVNIPSSADTEVRVASPDTLTARPDTAAKIGA
jgi:hypothetical protein